VVCVIELTVEWLRRFMAVFHTLLHATYMCGMITSHCGAMQHCKL
jgi:hypothetical protein